MIGSVIRLSKVTKKYDVGGETVKALDSATLDIKKGEFVSIVGPSGSGKSTMMNIIGCLDVPDEGCYELGGTSVNEYSENELAEIRNKHIGFVFQDFDLIGDLTAEENVELPLIYKKVEPGERKECVKRALDKVGLSGRRTHKPSQLSGGQQQRVAIARAMVTGPSIILADEPTGNLDSKTGKDIMELFHEMNAAGNTIVLITHDNEIARQASRIVKIKDGKLYV